MQQRVVDREVGDTCWIDALVDQRLNEVTDEEGLADPAQPQQDHRPPGRLRRQQCLDQGEVGTGTQGANTRLDPGVNTPPSVGALNVLRKLLV